MLKTLYLCVLRDKDGNGVSMAPEWFSTEEIAQWKCGLLNELLQESSRYNWEVLPFWNSEHPPSSATLGV